MKYSLANKTEKTILSLGAESQGNFSCLKNNELFFSDDYGSLLEEKNFLRFKNDIFIFLDKNNIKPDVFLSDLHPFFETTKLGKQLAKEYRAKFIPVQHHHAHIFGAYGEQFLNSNQEIKFKDFVGIATDGTGYGLDENIWGGEIFLIKTNGIKRIGQLENQFLIGAEKAIDEPARMLISILNNIFSKEELYSWIKKYYNKNQFELLYNQLQENFNCITTSSTGRILDAAAVLLNFSNNKREEKHGPALALENNSTTPFDINPQIINKKNSKTILTTPLFKYLIKNKNQDKKRLAATAQKYIAQGFYEIASGYKLPIYFAGGMANNKIISSYLEPHKVNLNKKIPRGDAGISFGQIFFNLYQQKT